jgi:hypothetical protein
MPPSGQATRRVTPLPRRFYPTAGCSPRTSWEASAPVSAPTTGPEDVNARGRAQEPRRADVRARSVDVRRSRREAHAARSGAAPPESARRSPPGSRPSGGTRSSRARRNGGARLSTDAARSSANSDAEARIRGRAAPRSRTRPRPTPRRPRHACPPQSGARPSASRTTRGVTPPTLQSCDLPLFASGLWRS